MNVGITNLKKILKNNLPLFIIGGLLMVSTLYVQGVNLKSDFGVNTNFIEIHIRSNNINPEIAYIGDTVTLTIAGKQAFFLDPVMSIDGQQIKTVYLGQNNENMFEYEVNKVMTRNDTKGLVSFGIEYIDYFDNTVFSTKTTDKSSVFFNSKVKEKGRAIGTSTLE